jgi:uncharacterized protein with HEPN domain
MSPSTPEVLQHILEEADYLLRSSRDLSREDFLADETLRRAFVRSLEVIGEAAKKVSPEIREQHPAIEWKAMAGMRDRLIHVYFGVDYELVWSVVTEKISILHEQIASCLSEREGE